MDTLELEKLVQSDNYAPHYFCGVWSADHLKQFAFPKHRKAIIIVNLSRRGSAGTHWVSIAWLPRKKHILYMDSLALDPRQFVDIHTFLLRHTDNLQKSCHLLNRAIQHQSAHTCGLYCLLWVYQFARGWSLDRFSALFSVNLQSNEEIVQQWSTLLKLKAFSSGSPSFTSKNW